MTDDQVPHDYVDGEAVHQRIVSGDEMVHQYQGSIRVLAGGKVNIAGNHQGSLWLEEDAQAVISGNNQGSLHVAGGARAHVVGRQQGSTHVAANGLIEVAASGALQGSLHVEGEIRNAGIRGGTVSGPGTVSDLSGARVVQPIRRGDALVYEWPAR